MVWGAITGQHRTPLIFVEGTLTANHCIHEVLEPHVLAFIVCHPEICLFQLDAQHLSLGNFWPKMRF